MKLIAILAFAAVAAFQAFSAATPAAHTIADRHAIIEAATK